MVRSQQTRFKRQELLVSIQSLCGALDTLDVERSKWFKSRRAYIDFECKPDVPDAQNTFGANAP